MSQSRIARANPSRGHTKQPPHNIDVLGCSYVEVSPNPLAKVLMYNVYTPLPKNLPSMFQSLSHPNKRALVNAGKALAKP